MLSKSTYHSSQISAAILVGGQSRRMGKNKALVTLNGKKLIEHVITAVSRVTDELLLITNTPEEYAFLQLPMRHDHIEGIGPLGGIYTALIECKANQCLVVACDLPFLHSRLLKYLCECIDSHSDVTVMDTDRGVEPLCAIYSKSCLPVIKKKIIQKAYKVTDFFRDVNVQTLHLALESSDYAPHLFYNVNTPTELQRAHELIRNIET